MKWLSFLLCLLLLSVKPLAAAPNNRVRTQQVGMGPDYHHLPLLQQRFSCSLRAPAQELVLAAEKVYVRLLLAGDRSNQPIVFHASNVTVADMMDSMAAHFNCQWYASYSHTWILASSLEEATTYWNALNAVKGDARREYMLIKSGEQFDELVASIDGDQWRKLKADQLLESKDLSLWQRNKVREALHCFVRSELGTSPDTPHDKALQGEAIRFRFAGTTGDRYLVVDYPRKVQTTSREDTIVPLKQLDNGTYAPARERECTPLVTRNALVADVPASEFEQSFTYALQTADGENVLNILTRLGALTKSSFFLGGEWIDQPMSASGTTPLGVMKMLSIKGKSNWRKAGKNIFTLTLPVIKKPN